MSEISYLLKASPRFPEMVFLNLTAVLVMEIGQRLGTVSSFNCVEICNVCGTVLSVTCFTSAIIGCKPCPANLSTKVYLSAEDRRIFS